MEPFRAVVDRVALDLVRSRTLSREDFDLSSNGVCRVRPELARVMVRAVDTALDCEPMVTVARDAFLAGGCEVQPREFAPTLVRQLGMSRPPARPVTSVEYSRLRQRSLTAPRSEPLLAIGRGKLRDRPPMPPTFVASFQALLDERGMSRTRLSVLCDFHSNYWQQVLGNTRYAPAQEALGRAASPLGVGATELLRLAGYSMPPVGRA